MRRSSTNYLVLIPLFLCSCAGYKVNVMGVEVSGLSGKEIAQVAAGAVVSFAVHEAAHLAALEYKGYDYEFRGMDFIYDTNGNGVDQTVQQAGFLAQIFTGAILNIIPYTKDSAFTLGFNGCAAVGAISYRARYGDGGDHQGEKDLWLRDSVLTSANTIWTVYNRKERKHVRTKRDRLREQIQTADVEDACFEIYNQMVELCYNTNNDLNMLSLCLEGVRGAYYECLRRARENDEGDSDTSDLFSTVH